MLHRYLPLLFLITCWPVQAQVYKCVAANGALTFSQMPCPDKDSKVTLERTVTTNVEDEADCKSAHRFALVTAHDMKRGVASSTVFDRYGGLSALSGGSVSLISYVYQYRTNDDVSAEKVAALSLAKCEAGSFGDVSCKQLPRAYTSSLGGCEMSDEMMVGMMKRSGAVESPPSTNAAVLSQSRIRVSPEARALAYAERREAKEREEHRRIACKKHIREKIDAINAQMRSGYSASQGTTLWNRLRDLEQQLREC